MSKELFVRFKNQLLGGTFLRDTNIWAEIIGTVDHEFWRGIHETEPYLREPVERRLDNITKGRIILERMEKESNPRRFADMLQAIYDALFLYSAIPENLGDDMWRTYTNRLIAVRDSVGFSDLHIVWLSEPEVAYTSPPLSERYYLPGEISITYNGPEWGQEDSREILEKGFESRVLNEAKKRLKQVPQKKNKFFWYTLTTSQKIQVVGSVFVPLLVAGATIYLGGRNNTASRVLNAPNSIITFGQTGGNNTLNTKADVKLDYVAAELNKPVIGGYRSKFSLLFYSSAAMATGTDATVSIDKSLSCKEPVASGAQSLHVGGKYGGMYVTSFSIDCFSHEKVNASTTLFTM